MGKFRSKALSIINNTRNIIDLDKKKKQCQVMAFCIIKERLPPIQRQPLPLPMTKTCPDGSVIDASATCPAVNPPSTNNPPSSKDNNPPPNNNNPPQRGDNNLPPSKNNGTSDNGKGSGSDNSKPGPTTLS
jgi:hypothetical protein